MGLVQISTFQQFDVYVNAYVQLKTGRKSKASYATLNYKKTIICTMYSKNVNSYANTRFVMTRYKNWQKKLTAVQKIENCKSASLSAHNILILVDKMDVSKEQKDKL